MERRILFIGGGNMAKAMITGLVNSDYDVKSILVADRNPDKLEKLENDYGVKAISSLSSGIKECEIIILAIKPQVMLELIKDIRGYITKKHLVITVAAGIQTQSYEKYFGKKIAFSRTIPNTPSSLGAGATGVFFNEQVSSEQKRIVIDIMQTMGIVVTVKNEQEIDVIAACASSGPAYYFQFMEHMVRSVVKMGLNKNQARLLVAQTCLGAAKMVLNSDEDLSTLRKNVTSKKGITAEALEVFDNYNFGEIVDKAIQANVNRARELAKELE